MPKRKHKDEFKKFDGKNFILYRKTKSKDIADAQAHSMSTAYGGKYFTRITRHPKNKTFKYKVWIRKK